MKRLNGRDPLQLPPVTSLLCKHSAVLFTQSTLKRNNRENRGSPVQMCAAWSVSPYCAEQGLQVCGGAVTGSSPQLVHTCVSVTPGLPDRTSHPNAAHANSQPCFSVQPSDKSFNLVQEQQQITSTIKIKPLKTGL